MCKFYCVYHQVRQRKLSGNDEPGVTGSDNDDGKVGMEKKVGLVPGIAWVVGSIIGITY